MVLFDEMYIQKSTQFHGGKHTGADEDGTFFKGVVVCFMVVGLKRSVPIVVKAVPETGGSGNFIAENVMDIISKLARIGFNVLYVTITQGGGGVNFDYKTDRSE